MNEEIERKIEDEAREYLNGFFGRVKNNPKINIENVEGLKKYLVEMKESVEDVLDRLKNQNLSITEYKSRRDREINRYKILEKAQELFDEEYNKYFSNKINLQKSQRRLSEAMQNLRKTVDTTEILEKIKQEAKEKYPIPELKDNDGIGLEREEEI